MTPARYCLDTNVLVLAHMPNVAGHAAVNPFLASLARRDNTHLAVTPLVLHELVHVITDARRFEPPVDMSEAIALARSYLGRTNVDCLDVTEEAMALALDLLDRHRPGRKRIADALLTATCLVHGVTALVTCNPEDFSQFADLTLLDPRVHQA